MTTLRGEIAKRDGQRYPINYNSKYENNVASGHRMVGPGPLDGDGASHCLNVGVPVNKVDDICPNMLENTDGLYNIEVRVLSPFLSVGFSQHTTSQGRPKKVPTSQIP